MAVDIYLRLPNDPNYNANYLEVQEEVSNFVQRIEMILTTVPGEVLGEPDFGVNLESFLWNPYITVGSIRNEINRQVRRYLPTSNGLLFDIDVKFIKGEISDSILIDIVVDGNPVLGIVATGSPSAEINLNV